jgi:sterol desaturase/sphingolipid hydroxylase (fatty acid hydroxylase superfamily)
VHHRLPESNYGQYIMLWDHAFGSYRPYQEHYGSGAGSSTAGTAKAKAA